MTIHEKISTGLKGFDQVIDRLRLGDNVVWQTVSPADYKKMAEPFIHQAREDGRKLVYVRFGNHEPILAQSPDIAFYRLDAKKGFESFATEVHRIIEREGRETFYVFDCLTDLLEYWHSDWMIGNFFRVTCPYLYELDTIAYFAIKRNVHTYGTIAGIRETTQLLLDLYVVNDRYYVHPLKVWQRYSPTMFFPHRIEGQEAASITASSEAAELFSSLQRGGEILDYWDVIFQKAARATASREQDKTKRLLMSMLIGSESRMFRLCDRYFTLKDILRIASREVGTGFIGGKSVGMLLARKILDEEGEGRFASCMEPHDSYYLGSDIFYTYIVQNGWWELRIRQKTKEGYYSPLQTKGLGKPVKVPRLEAGQNCFFRTKGGFMGGNIRLPLDYIILVIGQEYRKRNDQGKYSVARTIGRLNSALKGKKVLLAGPGRWGTSTPSLGVPVHFAEICNMSAICEVASREEGFLPELSYGSHFFQDLVESGIFYAAIFDGNRDVVFHPEYILSRKNIIADFLPQEAPQQDVIHLTEAGGMEITSDIVEQTLLCR